jgi:putative ABC transport system permease protein
VRDRINAELPGNKISLTRDLVTDAQERIPGLNTFLRVLVALGAFVSTIFVLLSMYTTITERRKEIGILKSLGASKGFIISTIEGEAFMIGVLGVILGAISSLIASQLISREFDLAFEFSPGWTITAVLIAIGGSLFGAFYPAWRASTIDPVEVMVNE